MTKLDTSAFAAVTTQSESPEPREIPVAQIGTTMLDLPEMWEADADKYVFRLAGGPRFPSLTILLDTKQLEEQTRVKKINRAIRRAHKR